MSDILNTRNVNVFGLASDLANHNAIVQSNDFDVMMVNSVSYSVPAAPSTNVYVLWCSLTGSYITSFTTDAGLATISPNVIIKLPRNNGNQQISFALHSFSLVQDPQMDTAGIISISLSFIKYRNQ